MNIIWYGYSCFRIQEQTHNNDEVVIVTDPYSSEFGKLPRNLTADIVTVSHGHPRHDNVAAVSGTPFIIDGPGEFEVKDAFVTGVESYHDEVEGKEKGKNTVFYLTIGGVHMAHLGDLKRGLDQKSLEDMHDIDVLFVPVGGGDVLDAKQAVDIIGQFDPRVIIPMHFRTPRTGKDLRPVDDFLKALGVSDPERVGKLKLTDKDLPQEDTRIIIFEPQ